MTDGSVDRYTSHETFSTQLTLITLTLWLKVSQRVSDKTTHAHVITCLSVRCLFLFCLLPLPLAPLPSLSLSTCSLSCSSTSMVAIHNPLTDSDIQRASFSSVLSPCCCETWTKETDMSASFLGVSRDMDQGVYPSGTVCVSR